MTTFVISMRNAKNIFELSNNSSLCFFLLQFLDWIISLKRYTNYKKVGLTLGEIRERAGEPEDHCFIQKFTHYNTAGFQSENNVDFITCRSHVAQFKFIYLAKSYHPSEDTVNITPLA